MATTLADMAVGQQAEVTGIDGTDSISLRLLEMGLTPGVMLHVIGTAPLGDPLEIDVRGYRLSVRRSEAERVAVKQA
jgi:ferrous iron transport protein A